MGLETSSGSPLSFLFCWTLLPIVTLIGAVYDFPNITSFIGFIAIPIADLFVGQNNKNANVIAASAAKYQSSDAFWYRLATYVYVPIQLTCQLTAGYLIAARFSSPSASFMDSPWFWGICTSMGLAAGGVGITLAHELIHKTRQFDRTLGQVLLCSVMYPHFFVEHLLGHHVNVATENDPASARRDESIYAFLPRSIIGSYLSAWHLENSRVRRHIQFQKEEENRNPTNAVHFHSVWNPLLNKMVLYSLIEVTLVCSIWSLFGAPVLVYFLSQSIVAILLLEAVNYIEHYGLTRKLVKRVVGNASSGFKAKKEAEITAVPEPVKLDSSWNNSNHISNLFLGNLQRHSDHHVYPTRPYQFLQTHPEPISPQLPLGYPSMVLLALVPPLYKRIMHPRIDALQAQKS